jgi:two-component system chemotaxis response regulator CheB
VRGLLSRWLSQEPDFDVVGCHATGRLAVDDLDRANPDIVVLDLHMPDMDGLSALPLLLRKRPDLTVLVCSTLTRPNAELSLRCLSLGADDYLAKAGKRPRLLHLGRVPARTAWQAAGSGVSVVATARAP